MPLLVLTMSANSQAPAIREVLTKQLKTLALQANNPIFQIALSQVLTLLTRCEDKDVIAFSDSVINLADELKKVTGS